MSIILRFYLKYGVHMFVTHISPASSISYLRCLRQNRISWKTQRKPEQQSILLILITMRFSTNPCTGTGADLYGGILREPLSTVMALVAHQAPVHFSVEYLSPTSPQNVVSLSFVFLRYPNNVREGGENEKFRRNSACHLNCFPLLWTSICLA